MWIFALPEAAVAVLVKKLKSVMEKRCDQTETVIAFEVAAAAHYLVDRMTLNDPSCKAVRNRTHWVLKTQRYETFKTWAGLEIGTVVQLVSAIFSYCHSNSPNFHLNTANPSHLGNFCKYMYFNVFIVNIVHSTLSPSLFSTSCGSVNRFTQSGDPMFMNNVLLSFSPSSRFSGHRIEIPFVCAFRSGFGGEAIDDEEITDAGMASLARTGNIEEMYKISVSKVPRE